MSALLLTLTHGGPILVRQVDGALVVPRAHAMIIAPGPRSWVVALN